jgi:hypothetical protein
MVSKINVDGLENSSLVSSNVARAKCLESARLLSRGLKGLVMGRL